MKLTEVIELEYRLFAEFGNRKLPGRISTLYVVPQKKAYYVPLKIEHKDFLPSIIPTSEANEFLENAARVIPIDFDVDMTFQGVELKIASVCIGICGFEEHYGVRHSKKDLISAKDFASQLLKKSKQDRVSISVEQKYAQKE